ncbi:MAG: sodium ion-translocating decarboxylase subunit beta [Burkholderiales bacterium]
MLYVVKEGLFHYAYEGVGKLIIPPLIFLGVGAMTDFGPMIANPRLVILGAGAHLGIFVALILAKMVGHDQRGGVRSASSAAQTGPWRSSSR